MADLTRVVLADRDPQLREVLRKALETGGFEVCGEACDATEAVEQALSCRPHVVLLDIHMPGNGIRAAREVKSRLPEVAVVMLTSSRSGEDLFDALRAGASGYLLKGMDTDRLPHALRGVLAGESAIPRALLPQILNELRAPAIRKSGRNTKAAGLLTSREWEVMELLG